MAIPSISLSRAKKKRINRGRMDKTDMAKSSFQIASYSLTKLTMATGTVRTALEDVTTMGHIRAFQFVIKEKIARAPRAGRHMGSIILKNRAISPTPSTLAASQ
jgi:hypothetical protein